MDIGKVKELKKTTEVEIDALLTNLLRTSGLELAGMTFHIVDKDHPFYRRVEVKIKLDLNLGD